MLTPYYCCKNIDRSCMNFIYKKFFEENINSYNYFGYTSFRDLVIQKNWKIKQRPQMSIKRTGKKFPGRYKNIQDASLHLRLVLTNFNCNLLSRNINGASLSFIPNVKLKTPKRGNNLRPLHFSIFYENESTWRVDRNASKLSVFIITEKWTKDISYDMKKVDAVVPKFIMGIW